MTNQHQTNPSNVRIPMRRTLSQYNKELHLLVLVLTFFCPLLVLLRYDDFVSSYVFVPTPNKQIKMIQYHEKISAHRVTRLLSQVENQGTDVIDQEVSVLSDVEEAILFGTNGDTDTRNVGKTDLYGNRLSNVNHNGIDLDHVPDHPIINKLRTMRDTALTTCPDLWSELATIIPDQRALFDEHLCDNKIDWTFQDAYKNIQKSTVIFHKLLQAATTGSTRNVAIFAENSAYWLLIDHGIQRCGGTSAVRGADAPIDELRYIYEHSDSANFVVLQDVALLQKLYKNKSKSNTAPLGLTNSMYGDVKSVVIMHNGRKNSSASIETAKKIATELNIEILFFGDLLEKVTDNDVKNVESLLKKQKRSKEDVATIVYTSGTTGNPKGVVLTHSNLLHQLSHRLAPSKPFLESEPLPGETMVSLLPVWHITERTFELWMLSRGCAVVYSTIRTFKKDLATHQPQWMVLVPRVLEKIALGVQEKFSTSSPAVRNIAKLFTSIGRQYTVQNKIANGLVVGDTPPSSLEKIKAKVIVKSLAPLHAVGQKLVWSKVQDGFGGKLKTIISGGSALSSGLETFYETAGFTVCVGYGLTECSPLLSFRRTDRNLVTGGCTGKACQDTEIRVVDPEATVNGSSPRPAVPHGRVGLVLGKGPQVMKGYYKNPEATSKAVDKFGYFDTGDLGRINPATGDLILTGRVKDTIVLSNGENIEPVPIEDAIAEIPLVEQVMVTTSAVEGEGDGKSLIAVTVLNPQQLYNLGYLTDQEQVKKLAEAMESINTPQCSEEDFSNACSDLLEPTSRLLRQNKELQNYLISSTKDVLASKKTFRKWEQVKDFYFTLEPFAMVNGQLTQSYKVKRAGVMERYQKEIAEMMQE